MLVLTTCPTYSSTNTHTHCAAGAAVLEPLILEDEREHSPLDSAGTQALLTAYDDDGEYSESEARLWAKHDNGRCSYRGYRTSRYPRRHECRAGHPCRSAGRPASTAAGTAAAARA
jgi:hypothetical protein